MSVNVYTTFFSDTLQFPDYNMTLTIFRRRLVHLRLPQLHSQLAGTLTRGKKDQKGPSGWSIDTYGELIPNLTSHAAAQYIKDTGTNAVVLISFGCSLAALSRLWPR